MIVLPALLAAAAGPGWTPASPGQEHLPTVRALLATRCAECHVPASTDGRARRAFDGMDDLARVREELVLPGDPLLSDLWLVVEDGSMPPEDSGLGPVTPEEAAALEAWIAAGAPLDGGPEDPAAPDPGATGPSSSSPEQDPLAGEDPPGPLGALVRRLHPVLVHFPIALLLTALVSELLQGRGTRPGLAVATRLCLWLGTLGALAAAYSGWGLSEEVRPGDLLERHRWLGGATALASVLALVLAELHALGRRPRWRWPLRLVLLLAAVLVGLTGHLGGTLVYGADWWTP